MYKPKPAEPIKEYQYPKGVESMWVVGNYEGETAKKVLANAHSGVGSYIILNQGGNRYQPSCLVAFRYAGEMPIPPHLQEVHDPVKIAEYEKTRKQRQGANH